jgi:hypothetical protein
MLMDTIDGGAIFIYSNYSSLYIENVTFDSNIATRNGYGGALTLAGLEPSRNDEMMYTGGPILLSLLHTTFTR